MKGFLLDSNAVSELVSALPNTKVTAWFDSIDEELFYLSALTIGEIRQGIDMLPQGRKLARLEACCRSNLVNSFLHLLNFKLDDDGIGLFALMRQTVDQKLTPAAFLDTYAAVEAVDDILPTLTRLAQAAPIRLDALTPRLM